MVSVNLYLDKRRTTNSNKYPLKLCVCRNSVRTYIATNMHLEPSQFDKTGGKDGRSWIKEHPKKEQYNRLLLRQIADTEECVLQLEQEHALYHKSAKELHNLILSRLNGESDVIVPTYKDVLSQLIKSKNKRVIELHLQTFDKITTFASESVTMEEIDFRWLQRFETYLLHSLSINTVAIHLRNIRAVFNYALTIELITAYPFRKFRIQKQKTPKRALTAEQLVTLRDYPCEEHQVQYRDYFMLSFYLIGINAVDLLEATHKNVNNGRLVYYRAKTHKLYNIRIEPEAQELLDKYAGTECLLDAAERYDNYKDYLHRVNENLQSIGTFERTGRGGKKVRHPLFPDITTYWARHTWATIAHKIGISKDVISMSLGHELGGSKITDVYIDYDADKVDDANRKVIDYVNKTIVPQS